MSRTAYPRLAELLRKARALVEQGWTQGTMARDRQSHRVTASSPRACRFCPYGAVLRASGGDPVRYLEAGELLASLTPSGHIVTWNDAPVRKKAEVLALFDAAIELTERQ